MFHLARRDKLHHVRCKYILLSTFLRSRYILNICNAIFLTHIPAPFIFSFLFRNGKLIPIIIAIIAMYGWQIILLCGQTTIKEASIKQMLPKVRLYDCMYSIPALFLFCFQFVSEIYSLVKLSAQSSVT